MREIVGTEIRVQGVEVGVQEQNSGGMVLQKPLQGAEIGVHGIVGTEIRE